MEWYLSKIKFTGCGLGQFLQYTNEITILYFDNEIIDNVIMFVIRGANENYKI